MQTLRQDGWRKVISGITTPEEVIKVTPQEEKVGDGQDQLAGYLSEEKAASFVERRAYPHLNCEATLQYKLYDPAAEKKKDGSSVVQSSIIKNMSAGGILFVATQALPINAVVELLVDLPDGNSPIGCLARVVRVEVTAQEGIFNVAVCFLDLTGAQRLRLNKFVELGLA